MCSVLLLSACTASLPSRGVPEPGTYAQPTEFRFHLFQRTYRVHVPKGYDGSHPVPMVVMIHSAFSSAKEMEKVTGFSSVADREGFVVLYPNGIGLFGWLRHWNSGHCCAKARESGVDDVGFLDAVIGEVTDRLNIDRSRIYMAGYSNGGMMAYRYAAERSEKIAAAAVVAGSIGGKPSPEEPEWRIPKPARAVPIIVFHGTADGHVPYDGGADPRGLELTWISVADSVGFWVEQNGCPSQPLTNQAYDGRVKIDTWLPCRDGASMLRYTLNGWGHTWPGPYFKDKEDGFPAEDFDAAVIIWSFFKSFHR